MADNDVMDASPQIDGHSYWSRTWDGRSRFRAANSAHGWNVLFSSASVLSERGPGFPENALSELWQKSNLNVTDAV